MNNIMDSEEYIDLINSDEWEVNDIDKIKNINYSGNNILHMACIRGRKDIIDNILNKYPELYYLSNKYGDNCAFILLKYGWIKIFKFYLKKYIDVLDFINNDGNSILQLCLDKKKLFRYLIDNLLDSQRDILNNINNEGKTILLEAIDLYYSKNIDINFLEYIISKVNLNIPKENPPLLYSIILRLEDVADLLLKYGAEPNINNNKGITPLMISIKNDLLITSEKLINKKANINAQDHELKNSPVNIAILKKNNIIFNLLFKNNINFDLKNQYMNTPMHYLIHTNKNKLWMDKKVFYDIIINNNLTEKNINGIDPLTILKKTTTIKREYINKLLIKNQYNRNREEQINMPKIIRTNYGQFNSDIIHNIFYTIVILKKYENLFIPVQNNNINNTDKLKMISYKSDVGNIFGNVIELFYEYFANIAPHLILWHNKNLYHIDTNLGISLQNILKNSKVRFIFFKLTIIINKNSSHANVIIYDKKVNEAYRFEPYGNINIYDYEILNEKIEKKLKKYINKNLKYISPKEFMENIPIQIMSNDFDQDKKKLGDPFGYCLAFCFWFIELRLLNPEYDIKLLMKRSFYEIMNRKSSSNKILDYIRNYSYKLNKLSIKFLKEAGIDKMSIYNLSFTENETEKILVHYNKELKELLEQRGITL